MSDVCNPDSCSTIGVLQLKIDGLMTKLGKQMQWVSVVDRLPEVGQLVLTLMGIEYYIAVFNGRHWGHSYNPTHWMPLPEPPKGEE